MYPPELFQYPDEGTLANDVARRWRTELTVASERPFCVALSGGRIARRFFSSAATALLETGANRGALEFFWADERCVPPNDPESNFALARQSLLEPLRVPEANIHRIPGELASELASEAAETEIRRIVAPGATGQPRLHLIFLGMGEDGHIASLFPGELENAAPSTRTYRAVVGPKPPPQRVTLSYEAICAAKAVWVLASGAGKEKALRDSLSVPTSTPLGRLLAMRENVIVFTDIALKASVGRPPRLGADA